MPKSLTRQQLQSRKDKAVRFVEDVLQDHERAEEIADESLESYAERRKVTLLNPKLNRRITAMPTKDELEKQIEELQAENEDLQDRLDTIAQLVGDDDDSNGGDDDLDDSDDDDED